jgi:hypothetical protein
MGSLVRAQEGELKKPDSNVRLFYFPHVYFSTKVLQVNSIAPAIHLILSTPCKRYYLIDKKKRLRKTF